MKKPTTPKRHPLVAALLADRALRHESRNAQSIRIEVAESTLRQIERTGRLGRNTAKVLSLSLASGPAPRTAPSRAKAGAK